jgi:hypothetical protein
LDQARSQSCLLYNFINTFYQMNYIFFSDNKWFLHPGDLPVKPSMDFEYISQFNYALMTYDNAIADIKAKALEIVNPELLVPVYEEDRIYILVPVGIFPEPRSTKEIKDGEFYQWPGTFERKETLYANDKYEVKYKTEVAHLVLPPEEKNMNEPIPPEYYLNGPDEFVNPNESTSAPVEKEEEKNYTHFDMLATVARQTKHLYEENARLRSLIENVVNAWDKPMIGDTGKEMTVTEMNLWLKNDMWPAIEQAREQFKKDNNL